MGILGRQSTILGPKKQVVQEMEACYHNAVGVLVFLFKRPTSRSEDSVSLSCPFYSTRT